jgi:hypothetical protein
MKQVVSSICETINELESKNLFKESDTLRGILVKLVTADLRDWFKNEKWVDLRRRKKPVCTPANKAKNLSKKERSHRLKQKSQKEKEPNPDKKPNVTKYTPSAGGKSNIS